MLGKVLKIIRKEKGLRQEDLAKIIGIDRTTLTKYETEKNEPDFKTLEKIFKTCDYEIWFINKKNNNKFRFKDIIRKDI